MNDDLYLVIAPEQAGTRLDVFLCGAVAGLSRRQAAKLIGDGAVRLDGRPARKADLVAVGQAVIVHGFAEAHPPAADAVLGLTILHEDAALVAVAKPSGMHTVPQAEAEGGTVAQALLARYPEMSEVGARNNEPGVCHRLDYWTSGVLLAARTRQAFAAVRASFAAHWVSKTYLALCAGSPPETIKVDQPIGHPARRATRVVVGADKGRGSRPAVTEYTVLGQYADCALVRAVCATGAMHQVRAHAAYAGFPLVGDTLYGGPAVTEGRFWLHAYSLALPHPTSGENIMLICPPPATFPQARDWHAAQNLHI